MGEFSCKWGVLDLCEHELHTLETFIIVFWEQQGYVTVAPAFSESGHILSGAICSRYWRPIGRSGTLV